MTKDEYSCLVKGDIVRANGGPLRGLVLEVVTTNDDVIFSQQPGNPAFAYSRNYRAYDLIHHVTDLEALIRQMNKTVYERNPIPSPGDYPEVAGTVNRQYYWEKSRIVAENRSESHILSGLFNKLSENGIRTLDDLVRTDPDDILNMPGIGAPTFAQIMKIRDKEICLRKNYSH